MLPPKRAERYLASRNGYLVNTVEFLPQDAPNDPPSAAVLIAHGYCHYIGAFFDYLAMHLWERARIRVFAIEHYGHGKSQGTRALIADFQNLVDDVLDYAAHLRGQVLPENLALFGYGESLGGAVMVHAASRDPKAFSGLLMLGPMCGIDESMVPPWVVVQAGKALAACLPSAPLAPVRDHLSACFKNPNLLALAQSDPNRYGGRMRLGTAFQCMKACQDIGTIRATFRVPFCILHGTADSVTSPKISEDFWKASPAEDKTLILYEDGYHVLWWETKEVRERVFEDVCGWMAARSGGATVQVGAEEELAPGAAGGRRISRDARAPEGAEFEVPGVAADAPWTYSSHPHVYGATHPSEAGKPISFSGGK